MSMIENCSLTDNMTNKAIRDQHRELYAEMLRKTGSQQSVRDRMLQEIQFLRDHEGGPMDEEVIDILRGNVVRLDRQRDELLAALEALIDMDVSYQRGRKVVEAVENAIDTIARVKGNAA